MKLNKSATKFIASAMALSLASAGVLAPEAGMFGKLIPTNSISAEAAQSNTYNGWTYEINSNQTTVRITGYDSNNSNSTNVTVPSKIGDRTVTALPIGLFKDNTSIKSVTLPNSITYIPEKCFSGATSLEKVTIPSGTEIVGVNAFSNTTSLKSVSLPSTVYGIRNYAFSGSGISNISMPGVTEMGKAVFASCNNLKSFSWPSTISAIPDGTFNSCSNLKTVSIPKNVTQIGSNAFANCGFSVFTLPNTVKDYGIGFLNNCKNLQNVNGLNAEVFGKLLKNGVFAHCEKLNYINNQRVVYSINGEPAIKTDYYKEIEKYFDKVDEDEIGFYKEFIDKKVELVVKNTITDDMSDIQKVKALHDWIVNKLEYAYDGNGKPESSMKCHVASSAFMRDTAVCEGYAKSLNLLLNKAGVEAYYVGGQPFSGTGGHGWSVVKINGNYYHVDATWDDNGNSAKYTYFLCSDESFRSNHEYKWSGTVDGKIRSYTTGVAKYDMRDLGDVNLDGKVDENDAPEIQKYLLKTNNLSEEQKMRADINMDGEIKMNDAVSINMALAKMKKDKYTKSVFEYIYIDGKMNV